MTTSLSLDALRARRRAVFGAFLVNGAGVGTFAVSIPAIRDHLELSTSYVGYLIAGSSAGAITGLLLASHVIQWLGTRRTLAYMLAITGLAIALMGVGTSVLQSFTAVIIAMAVFGFASATCDVAMNVEGAATEKQLGRTLLPLLHAVFSAGMVTASAIGTGVAFTGIDPALHLVGIGAAFLVASLLVPRAIPRVVVDAAGERVDRVSFRDRMSIWLEPRTLAIGLICLGMAFTEGAAGDWLPLAMVDERGLDNGQGTALLTVFMVSMMAGRLVGTPLIDRLGRVRMLRLSGATAAVGLGLVIFVPLLPVAIVGIVLWGAGASLGFPVAMSAAADDPVRATARVSAVATIGYCAFLVGPPLIGFVGERVGLLNALLIVFGLIVLATIAAPAARPRGGGPTVLPPDEGLTKGAAPHLT